MQPLRRAGYDPHVVVHTGDEELRPSGLPEAVEWIRRDSSNQWARVQDVLGDRDRRQYAMYVVTRADVVWKRDISLPSSPHAVVVPFYERIGISDVCYVYGSQSSDAMRSIFELLGDDMRARYSALDAQLHAALAANNVTPFAPEPGDAFDPATMEALRALSPPSGPPVVAEVLQRGYTMHDRVVRAAAVVTRDAEDSSSSSS